MFILLQRYNITYLVLPYFLIQFRQHSLDRLQINLNEGLDCHIVAVLAPAHEPFQLVLSKTHMHISKTKKML